MTIFYSNKMRFRKKNIAKTCFWISLELGLLGKWDTGGVKRCVYPTVEIDPIRPP